MPRTYHYCPEEHLTPGWVSKNISGESLSELLGSSKGETVGVAPVGRGGAFEVTGLGYVGKF